MIIRAKNIDTGEYVYLHEYAKWNGSYHDSRWSVSPYKAKYFNDDTTRLKLTEAVLLNDMGGGMIGICDVEYLTDYKVYIVHEELGKKYYYTGRKSPTIRRWTHVYKPDGFKDIRDAKHEMHFMYGDKNIKHLTDTLTISGKVLPGMKQVELNLGTSLYLEIE